MKFLVTGATGFIGARVIASLQRQRIKRLIAELEVEHPEVKSSMIRALGNVGGRHLLDKRLNPLPELRDTALASGAVPLRVVRPVSP